MPPLPPQTRPGLLLAAIALLAGCSSGTGDMSSTPNGGTGNTTTDPWMSSEVQDAWAKGYKGKGVTVTVVDDYNGTYSSGRLAGATEIKTHGEWTSTQVGMVAPEATVKTIDYNQRWFLPYFLSSGVNVVNNSYGIMGDPSEGFADLSPLEQATVTNAKVGDAVVVIAAGNDGVAVDALVAGQKDVLATSLIGTSTAIFVGALDKNGSTTNKANLADYSNTPGTNAAVQSKFLSVGVVEATTGMPGTSFAAPIVSGYAAILGSKFTTATEKQITNQLLSTARTDTINNYDVTLHGKGEASLTRALAPASLK